MRAGRWLLAFTLLLGSRCSVLGGGPEPRELSEARERWRDAAIEDYTFSLQRVCFCAGGVEPVRIVVRGGSPVSYTVVSTGEPLAEESERWYLTVSGLFDFVAEAIEREAHRIDVRYDVDRGFPVHIFIDYEERAADEEMGYELSAFTVD